MQWGDKMQKFLIVVDMQNDFIDGALGTAEAVAIVPNVKKKIESFDGRVVFTRDTHGENYLASREGGMLPVEHCIVGSDGWQIRTELAAARPGADIIDKPTFGSAELGEFLRRENKREPISGITLIGLCTDICVISNALLIRAFLPEVPITVDAACCAGVTPQSHNTALSAMKGCQIIVENEA